jgi:hypothetical protein
MRASRSLASLAGIVGIVAACSSAPQSAVVPPPPPPVSTQSVAPTVLAATVVATTGAAAAPATTSASTTTASPTTPAPVAPTAAPVSPDKDPCAGVDFRNFTYYLPDYELVTVKDGVGARGEPGDKYYVRAIVRAVAVGDIGGENDDVETVVFIDADTGGDERFSDVHVISCSPTAVTITTSAGGGDRAYGGIRSIVIQAGKLLVDRYADDNGVCCPAAAARTTYVLSGTKLVAEGNPVIRKLTVMTGVAAVPLGFFNNSSTALIMGETGKAQPAGFTAFAGQTVALNVEPAGPDQSAVTIDLVQGTKVLGSAPSASSVKVKLLADGYYELVARPATAGANARFDAEVTIG